MATEQKWTKYAELPGKFLANGGHAQQEIPSQHRLLNAGGMFAGWWALDQLRHTMFGVKMKAEGEYVEVKREDVPAPLRFLHKAIDWDPHSETPENQWKKLAYQLLPGVGAGVGAVIGSMYAFERNGRAQTFKANELKGISKLNMLDLDFQAQYAQSKSLRVLSGFFGTFSAASGLTFLYGFFLNPAFASANGAKVFAGSLAKGNAAPHKAVASELGMVGSYIQDALKTGKVREDWAKQFELRVLEPLFGHELQSPEAQQKAVKTLQTIVEESFQKYKANGKPAKDIAKAVTDDLTKKLGKEGIDKTLRTRFGLDPKNAKVGNANPIIHAFNESMASLGLGKSYKVGQSAASTSTSENILPVVGAGAAIVGGVALSNSYEGRTADTLPPMSRPAADNAENGEENANASTIQKHDAPEVAGKSAEEYVKDAVSMHTSPTQGKAPPGWLKWMGDAQLAVLPTNRIFCALGLTSGQIIGGSFGKILTGHTIEGAAVETSKIPTYLQWMKGAFKDYNPKGLRPRDRWIQYAQWAIFSAGGLLGVKLGTDYAYKGVKEKNRDPHYLEDYLPRVSMHQGKLWSWLSAFSANFGSASGLWLAPIPGLNYGISLAARATSMQDRNFMLPKVGETLSGSATTSFLRLREGVNYLCHYAVGNPSENPQQLEYIAYTLLKPLFKDDLKAEHIKKFTDAVHDARDQYWQEGGIPKEKRAEALKVMKEVFTGAGLEVLLIDMGLNPGMIAFDELNGLTGKIGNMGIAQKIKTEQENYHKALDEHLKTYVKENMISQERADWVRAGMEAMKHGKKHPDPLPVEKDEPAPASQAKPEAKFADKVPHKNSIDDLIKRSEKPGDWREAAHLSKENPAPAAVGG